MIMIPVDEADAFDRLAIEIVKNKGLKQYDLSRVLEDALGMNFFDSIKRSSEFNQLLEANRSTFNWVEKAKLNECSAQDVDRANYQRYLAKKALQEKFFPKSPLTETKTERPY